MTRCIKGKTSNCPILPVTHNNSPPNRIASACFYLTGTVAIAIYCIVVYQNTDNIPKWDDFPDILQFLDHWLNANDLTDKLSVLVSQTNEHILLVNHLLILCQYYIIGHLNFAGLIYLGNVFYLGSAVTLWHFFRAQENRAFCFAVLMLTGVSFYSCESTLWAMTALSNQAVIFFSLLAIYCITRASSSLILTMLLTGLAVFSQSNGLLLLPVIAVYFALNKSWTRLIGWSIFSVVIVSLYVHWFNPASQQDIDLHTLLHQLTWQNYAWTLPTLIASLASAPFTQADAVSVMCAILPGVLVAAVLMLNIGKRLYKTPLALVLGFLLLSLISLAAYRGLIGGIAVAFISRYKMYAAYILGAGVLLSPLVQVNLWQSPRRQLFVVAIATGYFVWSFPANLTHQQLIDNDLFTSLQHWVEDGDFRRARGFFVPNADRYLFTAVENGTYSPLVLIPDQQIIHNVQILDHCPATESDTLLANSESPINIAHKNPNAIGIKVMLHLDKSENITPITVALCSPEHNYQFILPGQATPDSTRSEVKETAFYIPREKITTGKYTVHLARAEQRLVLAEPFVNKQTTR